MYNNRPFRLWSDSRGRSMLCVLTASATQRHTRQSGSVGLGQPGTAFIGLSAASRASSSRIVATGRGSARATRLGNATAGIQRSGHVLNDVTHNMMAPRELRARLRPGCRNGRDPEHMHTAWATRDLTRTLQQRRRAVRHTKPITCGMQCNACNRANAPQTAGTMRHAAQVTLQRTHHATHARCNTGAMQAARKAVDTHGLLDY
jgi:hypothetical protein